MDKRVVLNSADDPRLSEIAERLDLREVTDDRISFDLAIEMTRDRLQLLENRDGRHLRHQIDIDGFVSAQRSFPAARKGVLNQAIGRRTVNVIDATGGWGGDSLLLCSQGYRVTTIERNPLIAVFLEEAFSVLSNQPWTTKNSVCVPGLVCADAIDFIPSADADCIYIDTMFPPKRKASAGVNKTISMLQRVCGPDDDEIDLLRTALESPTRRVVVKRPGHSAPIIKSPSDQFPGKLVRYDLYMPG